MSSTGIPVSTANDYPIADVARSVYVVVEACAGAITGAYAFDCEADAIRCLDELQAQADENDDDVQLFKSMVGEKPI